MLDRIKLVLADDQTLFRESLSNILKLKAKEFDVVGLAQNGEEAVALAASTAPDIILMDVRMPILDGVEATKIIHERFPAIKIMMLTTFDDDEYILHAIQNGAIGYIIKTIPPNELITSIMALKNGIFQMSPSIAGKLARQKVWEQTKTNMLNKEPLPSWFLSLRAKERALLLLICQGYTNKEIGNRLYLAEQTVKNYTSRIYEAMEVDNRHAAIKKALDANIDQL